MSTVLTMNDRSHVPNNDVEFIEDQPLHIDESTPRRDLRALVFHFLYAVEAFDYQESLNAIIDNFNRGFGLSIKPDHELVKITESIIHLRDELDKAYIPYLANWRFERIGVCTKLILRYAIWELIYSSIDPVIVINEAVELAKCFAEKDAHKFINAVLDRVVKSKANPVEEAIAKNK